MRLFYAGTECLSHIDVSFGASFAQMSNERVGGCLLATISWSKASRRVMQRCVCWKVLEEGVKVSAGIQKRGVSRGL